MNKTKLMISGKWQKLTQKSVRCPCGVCGRGDANNSIHTHTHTHNTTVLLLVCNMSGSTRVNRYQKGKIKKVKTNLDLLEQEIVSGSGISWAICRQPRQHPTTQFFTGRMPFLTPNQQRQSTVQSVSKSEIRPKHWFLVFSQFSKFSEFVLLNFQLQ